MIDVKKIALDITNGKKRIKLTSIWDFRSDYNGHRALIRRSEGGTVAIAGMRPPQRECDEFYLALEIVNEVQNKIDLNSDKP